MTSSKASFYSLQVEVSTHSARASAKRNNSLARVTGVVRAELSRVEARITEQTTAFDPAIEGYVSYAVGSRGKRLRPLMALLSGGALGPITPEHIDLAVVTELIHIATLVHDDIMAEAERRRAQPTVNARWGNSLSVLLGDCLFAHALHTARERERPLAIMLRKMKDEVRCLDGSPLEPGANRLGLHRLHRGARGQDQGTAHVSTH